MATLSTPRPSITGVGGRIARSRLLFWLVALASLNAFAGIAIQTVAEHGVDYALAELFGVSAIVWTALAASLALLDRCGSDAIVRRGDGLVAALVVAVALLPVATASAIALTILAIHMIATGAPRSAERRAGVIALAITGSLIWGRLLLALFSGPMLGLDSWLVGQVAGAAQSGNVIALADGSGRIAVAPGCSSWQGMSLAFVFWATVNQWFQVPLSWRAAGWCAAALAATMAINVARISAMVLFPAHLEEIHHGYGWHLSMWLTLAAVCALCLYGARREVFGR
ncbi:MAG: hypothetical protein JWO81_448 [Alphaproteobacteria bacterium]|nr:hypothetical protein [Alphaproteobacteria bacterium]